MDSGGKLRITLRRVEVQRFESFWEFHALSENPDLSEYFDCATNCKSHFGCLRPGGSTEKNNPTGKAYFFCNCWMYMNSAKWLDSPPKPLAESSKCSNENLGNQQIFYMLHIIQKPSYRHSFERRKPSVTWRENLSRHPWGCWRSNDRFFF